MSKEYDNTNSGALFKNDKQGNEKWPDYRGSINVGGDEYWLNAWLRTSKKGEKFMSLTVKPKDGAPKQREQSQPDPDDDIPF